MKKIVEEDKQAEDGVQWTRNDVSYTLKGIVWHKGTTVSSGHYYAVTVNTNGDHWTIFDDNISEKKNWSWIKNEQAYLLFYEKDVSLQTKNEDKILSKNESTQNQRTNSDWIGQINQFNEPKITRTLSVGEEKPENKNEKRKRDEELLPTTKKRRKMDQQVHIS